MKATRKCKVCKQLFEKKNPLQMVCGIQCAIEYANQQKAKADKKETRERKRKLKTRRDYIKEAQIEFNKFIRIRDSNRPCISCGVNFNSSEVGGQYDCGHYLSRGARPNLRFHEHNAHAQCKKCNRYLSGNIANYRLHLIDRIGLDNVLSIEEYAQPKHYTIEELIEIKNKYRAKWKELTND